MLLYPILLHIHSIFRYFVMFLLFLAIINSLKNIVSNQPYLKTSKKLNLVAMVIFHVQILFGTIMYFLSPKVQFSSEMFHFEMLRFFTIEHILLMVIAMAIITIGYVKAKNNVENGHKRILLYYTLTLVLVVCAIPWPFRIHLLGGWF